MKIVFKENNNIIKKHIKMTWKIILFFTIFWTTFSFIFLLLTLFMSNIRDFHAPFIGSYQINSSVSLDLFLGFGIGLIVKLLSWVGLIFFLILNLVLINMIIVNEKNNGKIVNWLILPVSRSQVILSKLFYVIVANMIVLAPEIILILSFGLAASDAAKYFGWLTLYNIDFVLTIIFLATFCVLLATNIKKASIINAIIGIFAFWILLCWSINFYYLMTYSAENSKHQWMSYFNYLGPQIFIANTLNFSNSFDLIKIHDVKINEFKLIESVSLNVIMPIFCVTLTCSLGYLNTYLFKKMDLNI